MKLTSVGSFPKPPELVKARKNGEDTTLLEKKWTEFWIRKQEELGYDILVHGEMERGDMVAYFAGKLKGLNEGDKDEPVRSYGSRYWTPPEIDSKIRWIGPMTVKMWEYAQSLTDRPVKGMLTGPATIYDWSLNGYYKDRRSGVLDIAHALRREVQELIRAGAKYIQIDEPSFAHTWMYADVLQEALEITTRGQKAYFIFHTCYGEDVFKEIYPAMLKLPVDNLDIETANSDMRMLGTIAKHPVQKDFSIGVVDIHSHEIESVELVAERIKQTLKIVPRDQLWLDPDCGLKTRTVEEAIGKLRVISEAKASLA